MAIESGSKAPAFSMKTDGGGKVSLSEHKGKNVVLYFYPKDDTPGCTKEACAFRDKSVELKKLGAKVFGVSPDRAWVGVGSASGSGSGSDDGSGSSDAASPGSSTSGFGSSGLVSSGLVVSAASGLAVSAASGFVVSDLAGSGCVSPGADAESDDDSEPAPVWATATAGPASTAADSPAVSNPVPTHTDRFPVPISGDPRVRGFAGGGECAVSPAPSS